MQNDIMFRFSSNHNFVHSNKHINDTIHSRLQSKYERTAKNYERQQKRFELGVEKIGPKTTKLRVKIRKKKKSNNREPPNFFFFFSEIG